MEVKYCNMHSETRELDKNGMLKLARTGTRKCGHDKETDNLTEQGNRELTKGAETENLQSHGTEELASA
jgi:hypothetical protein